MNRRLYILLCLAFAILTATAQTDRQYIRRGNAAFATKKYGVAEVNFRKALAANAHNAIAAYNLGCAMQAQHKDSLALQTTRWQQRTRPTRLAVPVLSTTWERYIRQRKTTKSHRSLQEYTAKQSPSRQRTLQSYTVACVF